MQKVSLSELVADAKMATAQDLDKLGASKEAKELALTAVTPILRNALKGRVVVTEGDYEDSQEVDDALLRLMGTLA